MALYCTPSDSGRPFLLGSKGEDKSASTYFFRTKGPAADDKGFQGRGESLLVSLMLAKARHVPSEGKMVRTTRWQY
jgi:hypothetical protein